MKMKLSLALSLTLSLAVPLLSAEQQRNPEQECGQLQDLKVPAKSIALATSGATVKTAKLVAAAPEHKGERSPLNPTGVVLATPEYCQINGEIAPVDPNAPPIKFEVNVPTDWNGKVIHVGGGGYGGALQTGLGAPPTRYLYKAPYPLTRGYVTFGSDSGHVGNDASFAQNKEALINFEYAQLKKTHDVALQITKTRYRRRPVRTYFMGQSGGGREGLTVVQRFPADYDGVVVSAPAINYLNIMLRFNDVASAVAAPGGFLPPAKVKAFGESVLANAT
jgi:feruloyl esterase